MGNSLLVLAQFQICSSSLSTCYYLLLSPQRAAPCTLAGVQRPTVRRLHLTQRQGWGKDLNRWRWEQRAVLGSPSTRAKTQNWGTAPLWGQEQPSQLGPEL